MKNSTFLLTSCLLVPSSVLGQIVIEKSVTNTPGAFLQSFPGIELPDGMVVQGSRVNYTASVEEGSGFNPATTTFAYRFKQKRGNVAFGSKTPSAKNGFKADWYGENIILIKATDTASGKTAIVEDKVICEFSSRRVLGGDAESLSEEYRKSIRRGAIHDIRKGVKGMAYLPKDISRGDRKSEQMTMGFFETTEPRLFKTSRGTLLSSTQARRIGKGDAPEGQAIIIKRSDDQGSSWTNEQMLDQHGNDVWGYTAFTEVDGVVMCYVAAGHPSHQNSNKSIRGLYFYTSKDDGKTWSKRKRHDQISAAMNFNKGEKILKGVSPNCNILAVPGLSVDGKVAPEGQGLLFSTYAHGYLWASINGGRKWTMVGDYKALAKDGISIENELAWCVLDNADGDIYMIWRRQAFTGFKKEYVTSKGFKSGANGVTAKHIYNQELKNVMARRCHFGLRNIAHGKDKGKLILATQGAGSRHHIVVGVSKEPITKTITEDMFDKVTVMKDIAWGYCDLEHLSTAEAANKGLGKDGIMLFGESEPVHNKTHQFIPLSPSGKGKDERYTATCFMVSMDYLKFLSGAEKVNSKIEADTVSFEVEQGWKTATRQKRHHAINTQTTDSLGNVWGPMCVYNRESGVARKGSNCLVLGVNGAKANYATVALKASPIKGVSFHIMRYSGKACDLTLTVDYREEGGEWKSVYSKVYGANEAKGSYLKVDCPFAAKGKVEVRIGVAGKKGFLIDDFKVAQ